MSSTLFLSLPSDVLDKIALQTVIQPQSVNVQGCGLLPCLQTLSSLLLSCRHVHSNLSPSTNTYLYGQLFRILFDVTPIERRLGADAVRSTVLTHELHRRLHMLKRIRTYLSNTNTSHRRYYKDDLVLDLLLLLFMLTESDGKNHRQLRNVLGPFGVADLCSAILLSPPTPASATITSKEQQEISLRSLAMIILWINQDDVFESESAGKTEALLDLLEPLAIQSQALQASRAFVVNFTYFGLSCSLSLSLALAYTRLCIVERYGAINRRSRQSNVTPPPSSPRHRLLQSDDVDADFARLTRFHHSGLNCRWPLSLPLKSITIGSFIDNTPQSPTHTRTSTFEGEWDGGWFVPSSLEPPMCMVYRPMRFHIRAYVPCSSPESMGQEDSKEHEGQDLDEFSRTRFGERVEFTERPDSLTIYDPIAGQTSFYEPKSSGHHHHSADTVLCGETTAAHGATFGDFVFHGRTRGSDGRISIVRRPADPDMSDLGVWVFDGYVYGGCQFVGDWWNTSTTKDAPGGSGWFRLSKVTQ